MFFLYINIIEGLTETISEWYGYYMVDSWDRDNEDAFTGNCYLTLFTILELEVKVFF